ncbi:MAG: NAD(P)/FAD-dependent oxidoreductase [Kofleriaceae bacterium]
MTTRYDLCILGAGPAGLAAAARAHHLGLSTALVEAAAPGGAGIADGALSSKTLWHLAMDYARARRSDRGYDGRDLALAWPAVTAQVAAACGEARRHVDRLLASWATPSPAGGVVERVAGRGRFVDAHRVVIDGPAPRQLEAARFVVAVGSRPRTLPEVVVDGERIVTSDHIERLGRPPARLAILGAGVVGCEYATLFAGFGQTAVELFDRGPRILPFEDDDVAGAVAASFAGLGITVHGGARVERIERHGDVVRLTGTTVDAAGRTVPLAREVDVVLLAIGRAPSIADLGLELAGVATERGAVVATCRGTARTTAAHVWAAGDVTADVMLANVAEQEGRHAVDDLAGLAPRPMVHEAKSAIYFFRPEVGAVGLNELAARAAGIPHRVAVVAHAVLRRAIAMRATDGFVKLLAGDDGRLLGLRVVGPHASTCIQGVALLIERGGTLDDLERCPHPHPAITEGVQEAARLLLGSSVYLPATFPGLVRTSAWASSPGVSSSTASES